ncbi:MAG: dihydroorotase [Kofleriaceae bacterium]|nr:dihydroorotase [Kofleriaceae bacterium]MCL4224825.1 dihydroorotase [Myxococcales bacterium]
MDLVLRGGRVLGAQPGGAWLDVPADVRIAAGVIDEIGGGLRGGREIDCRGLWILPGLVDLRAHLREPGAEHEEDIASGSLAAARGGFTTVCVQPDTQPINDQRTVTDWILRRGAEVGLCRVRPVGAITRGLDGAHLAEIAEMKAAGAVALADGERCLRDLGVLRRALEYARTFDLPLVQHALDLELCEGGSVNEGATATRLGLRPQPAAAESAIVARDLEVVAWTGARYHVAHASAARTVALLREARRRGLPVTAEVTPHHLTLTEDALTSYDPLAKVTPPLRAAADRDALIEGLCDGTLDAIATDHAPEGLTDKELELEAAAPGMIGLETALALALGLVRDGLVPERRVIEALTLGPARAFALDAGVLGPGVVADLCVVDPDLAWTVDPALLASKAKNTPLLGRRLTGRSVLTILGGRAVHDLHGRCA